MMKEVDIEGQLKQLRKDVVTVKSASKRDAMIKQIKYLTGLKNTGLKPEEAYVLHNVPIIPPVARPPTQQPGNRIEYADVNHLYKDHMLAIKDLDELKEYLTDDMLIQKRKDAYGGLKAVIGVGEAIKGSSRGKQLKGYLKQIGGEGSPKAGRFQNKLLKKKQDFSGRATIYAEPNLGFNEMAVPEDMIWTMYAFHIIRDLVKNGYSYPEAKKAVDARTLPAQASFNRMIKQIPLIANRAPTLMQSNITAHFPVPVKGKTLGVNPLHLPLYAGDFDGDAMTIHLPMTPEAVEEAKKKLLPEAHIYDFRRGLNRSLVAPGHEAIIGSMHMTDPDMKQQVVEFNTEDEVIKALNEGRINVNTPIRLKGQ